MNLSGLKRRRLALASRILLPRLRLGSSIPNLFIITRCWPHFPCLYFSTPRLTRYRQICLIPQTLRLLQLISVARTRIRCAPPRRERALPAQLDSHAPVTGPQESSLPVCPGIPLALFSSGPLPGIKPIFSFMSQMCATSGAYLTFSQWSTKTPALVAVNLSSSKTTKGSP